MKRILPLGAALVVVGASLSFQPALAQYSNEFSLAKVKKAGTTSQSIAGSGQVKVQVQVNPDGTHKVIRVISSTNPGDNAAALEIAQTSVYSPAHKGTTPVVSFYDYILKFNGKSVSSGDASANAGDPASGAVDGLIRAGKYADAVAKATEGLSANPGNNRLAQLLGVAQYYNGDNAAAATAFDKVSSIDKEFRPLAGSAYATQAVKISDTDPAASLSYAQKAQQLAPGPNSSFALGVAQISNKSFADAVQTLKPLPAGVKDNKTKVLIEDRLMVAYLGNNDPDDANALAASIKQLDPNDTSGARIVGNYYLGQANTAMGAKNYDAALKAYDQLTSSTDTQVAVTANTGAAFATMQLAKPDYSKAKAYALKAVTLAPGDAQANFAAGVAFEGIYVQVTHSDQDKQQALTYLNKADAAAKAAGNTALSTQIEGQLKAIQ